MQINGNLQFSVLGAGELQNAIIERLASAPTGAAGRIYYDTVANAYFYYNGTIWVQFAAGGSTVSSFSAGTTGLTPNTATIGAVTLAGTLIAANGGTGFNTYAVGDLLYASTTTALSKLTVGTSSQVLHGGTTPSYGSVNLTSDVSGVLPPANGGTGVNNGASTLTLGGNLTTAGAFNSTFTMTAATAVTFPTSGTLATVAGTVTTVVGTANQIDVDSTDPQNPIVSLDTTLIAPGSVEILSTLQVDSNTADAFLYSDATKKVVSTGAATNGQLLIGSTGAVPVVGTLTASTGISVTNGAGTITIANTGVTSVAATSSSAGLVVGGSPITTTGTLTFALSSALENLSELAGTGFVVETAAGVFTNRSITGTAANIVVTNGDGVSASPTINLATVSQAASGTFSKVTLDGFGRVVGNTPVVTADITALVDGSYLRLDGTSTPTADISFGGFKVTNIGTATVGTDATNKNYVDALVSGLEWKAAAQAATTANGTLATAFVAGTVIDGYTLVLGDRLLIKNQTTQTENGIYIVTAGTPTRSTDAATTAELNNATLFIINGTANGDTGWTQTTPNPVVGTSNIVFAQFTGAGTYTAGTGLALTGNTFSVLLGAGIAELPTGDVGIDLFNATTGALILTDDGTTRATDASSQLFLLLDGAGALAQTAAGLKINAASVTNAMLVNSTIPTDVDGGGTTTMTLGTGFNFFGTANRITTAASANTVTFDISASYVGQSSITTLGTITTGTWNGTTVAANHGGTGFAAYTVGDILAADSTSTLSKVSDVAVGNVLLSGGVGALPAYGKVDLTAAVSGILPSANGGTGVNNSFNITLGGAINTAGAFTTVGANSLTLTTTGATNVTLPTSGTLLTSATAVTTFSGGTTGLTPASATSGPITLAGTLAVANGGTGLTTVGAAGTVLASTGSVNAYTPIQFVYSSALNGGPNTSFTVAHNLGQQYCNVTVYDASNSMIIPQSVVLTDASTTTVTVNSAINVFIVVMGVTGVAAA